MRANKYQVGLGLLVLCFGTAALSSGSEAVVQRKVSLEQCHGCHMPWGEKHEPWIPNSYGQPRAYLRRMLAQFKTGQRVSAPMAEVSRQYTEDELDRLSDLMASHEPLRIKQATDASKVRRGQVLYQIRCMGCHTDEGRGSEFDAPLLAGQPIEYLRRQFSFISQGERKAHYMMREVYVGLKEEELEALAHFFASRE